MIYTPIRENWYFSRYNIPNLGEIQQELLALKASDAPRTSTNPLYFNILAKDVFVACPKTHDWLLRCGVAHKVNRLLFSANSLVGSKLNTIHVVSYNPYASEVSLNIPLVECDGSYTVFYKTSNVNLMDASEFGLEPNSNFARAKTSETEEIFRGELTTPMLVNTTILHNGVATNPNRTLCGFRFFSTLTDLELRRIGIEYPYSQVDK